LTDFAKHKKFTDVHDGFLAIKKQQPDITLRIPVTTGFKYDHLMNVAIFVKIMTTPIITHTAKRYDSLEDLSKMVCTEISRRARYA